MIVTTVLESPREQRAKNEAIDRLMNQLPDVSREVADDVHLILTELIANCYKESLKKGGTFTLVLRAEIRGRWLFILLSAECIRVHEDAINAHLDNIRRGDRCDFYEREGGLGMRFAYALTETLDIDDGGVLFALRTDGARNETRLRAALCV